eukprot:TRINITY_DN3381_c0_g1_i1.p1 TRINITY_DN3381_c0_g1~~TRINITY_DN3381_c0_g1_i1.p1  ORF type:complete len:316 (-),score=48.62 TRINITY_DN3381_c0_g1_i1:258-1205(-)
MSAIRVPIIIGAVVATRVFRSSADDGCHPACTDMLPAFCNMNLTEGGCCGDDGFRISDGSCELCETQVPQGSAYDHMCSCGQRGASKCNSMDRQKAAEPTCQNANCSGGCLMDDGVCNFTITEVACNAKRRMWCHACSHDVWLWCGPWADCYSMCTGCCMGTAWGSCPEEPTSMNVDGGCSACGGRPAMCDACFPESACSTAYDSKYPIDFDNYVRPWVWSVDLTTTTKSTSVASGSSSVSASTTAAAQSEEPTTAATTAESTGPAPEFGNETERTTKKTDEDVEPIDELSGVSQLHLSGCMGMLAVLVAAEQVR